MLLSFTTVETFPVTRTDCGGESHDQAVAEWIVIRTQLRGHNDMPYGRPAPGRPN